MDEARVEVQINSCAQSRDASDSAPDSGGAELCLALLDTSWRLAGLPPHYWSPALLRRRADCTSDIADPLHSMKSRPATATGATAVSGCRLRRAETEQKRARAIPKLPSSIRQDCPAG